MRSNKREREMGSSPLIGRQKKTLVMWSSIFSSGKLDDTGKVKSDKNVLFKIVDSEVTDFSTELLLSLGEQTFEENAREGIILDPKSQTLNNYYLSMKNSIILKTMNFDDVLNFLLSKLITIFKKNEDSDIKKVLAFCQKKSLNDQITPQDGRPCILIPLQGFVVAKVGVCRHHALLACYFIHRLIKDHLLDAQEVHHVRGHIKSGGHSWVMIKRTEDEWVHFDSQWKCVRKMDNDGYMQLCKSYTKEAIDGVKKKLFKEAPEELQKTLTL